MFRSFRTFMSTCCAVLGALFTLAGPAAAAYVLVTADGRMLPAESVDLSGAVWMVKEGGTPVEVDVEATFRHNIETAAGGPEAKGFVHFNNGSFIKFESATLGDGLISFHLGEKGKVKVPASLIDYRKSVVETAAGRSPKDRAHDVISRPGEGGPTTAGGQSVGTRNLAGGGVRGGVSPAVRRQRTGAQPSAVMGSVDSVRAELSSPNSPPLDAAGTDSDIYSGTTLSEGSGPTSGTAATDTTVSQQDTGQQGNDSQQESGEQPESSNVETDRPSEGHGTMSFTVTTDFLGELGGVQIAVGFPVSGVKLSRITKLGDFAAGTAMNGPRCHGATAPPNMSSSCFIVAMTPNPPVLGPTEIARYDFTWQDRRPAPSEFQLLQATGSDEGGTAIRTFRAQLRQN